MLLSISWRLSCLRLNVSDHSYIAIAIVKGKMLAISIHMSPPSSNPTTPDHSTVGSLEKPADDQCAIRPNSPVPSLDTGVSLAPLLTARCCFGIASINETIYVVGRSRVSAWISRLIALLQGGYNRGDCLDTIEQYDPKHGNWNLIPSPLKTRRGRVSAAIVQNRMYVCGGSDGQKELHSGEYFDLKSKQTCSIIEKLTAPVAHSGECCRTPIVFREVPSSLDLAMCSDAQFVYLIGGIEGDKCKSDCYRYDPQGNSWTKLPAMNSERSQAGVVYYQEKIYVFGGSTLTRCLSSCEILTLSTNQWSFGPAMKESRRGCGAVLYHEKMFVIGGSNGVTSLVSVEIFDPRTNEWLVNLNGYSNDLNVPRIGLGVTVCCDRIYAIGGFDGRAFLKSIEVYDENTQRWHANLLHPIGKVNKHIWTPRDSSSSAQRTSELIILDNTVENS